MPDTAVSSTLAYKSPCQEFKPEPYSAADSSSSGEYEFCILVFKYGTVQIQVWTEDLVMTVNAGRKNISWCLIKGP